MKPIKNTSKLKLNKSEYQKSKSKSKIKICLTQNKSAYNIRQYIKNKNDLILSDGFTSSIDDDNNKSNILYKIEEKEKIINSYKTKLEKEKLINKNLWNELNKYKSAMNKTRDNYNKIINKKQTKSEELIAITSKLTKLIEMVINFSYSMAYLRSNIYPKNKKRYNESTLAYESLNNNLKQIYNEFDQINKWLQNVKEINIKAKQPNKSPMNIHNNKKIDNNDSKKRKSKDNINNISNQCKTELNKIEDNKNDNDNNKTEKAVEKIYNTNINVNSPIKEEKENSIEFSKEENQNNLNININSNTNNISSNIDIKNEANNDNINPVDDNNKNNAINYKKINNNIKINDRDSLNKEENNDSNDFDKIKKGSFNNNIFLRTNSDKVFTFRNNSQISKDGDKISEKINLGDSLQPTDITKIIEENKNLKMQLASEKLKKNINLNNSQSESHNDEEYEEIISELKKKMEEKDKIISELKEKINLNINKNMNNNVININNNNNKNDTDKICNNINVNVNLNEMEKMKGNYQENINTIRSIYERMLIEKENKINELMNEINILEKDIEELNDKYDKEKEISKIYEIKINELENEKISLLVEIKNLRNDK